MKSSRRSLALIALVAALASACGGGDGGAATADDPAASSEIVGAPDPMIESTPDGTDGNYGTGTDGTVNEADVRGGATDADVTTDPTSDGNKVKDDRPDAAESASPACQALTIGDATTLLGEDTEQQDRREDDPTPKPTDDLDIDACHYFAKRGGGRRVSLTRFTAKTDAGRALIKMALATEAEPAGAGLEGAMWAKATRELRIAVNNELIVIMFEPPKGTDPSAAEAKKVWDLVRPHL